MTDCYDPEDGDYDPELRKPRTSWLAGYFGFLTTEPISDAERHTAADGFDAGANWMWKRFEKKGFKLDDSDA